MKESLLTITSILKATSYTTFFCLTISNSACFYNKNKTYRKPLVSAIQTLNPKHTRERSDFMIAKAILGQFLIYDSYGNIQPAAFSSWQVSDDGMKYTFNVRKNLYFHNERVLTSEDIDFSLHFLATKDSLVSRYFAGILGYEDYINNKSKRMTGIKILSGSQIEIYLHKPSFIFLSLLADPKLVVLPNNLLNTDEETFFKKPIGTGPYLLKSINADKSQFVLERFEKYYEEKSNIKQFIFDVYNKEQALSLFKAGKLDDLEIYFLLRSEAEDLKDFARIYSESSYAVNLLFFNGRKSYLNNDSLRAEIANLIKNEEYGSYCDMKIMPLNGIVPHGLLGWNIKKSNSILKINKTHEIKNKRAKLMKLKLLAYGNSMPKCFIQKIIDDLSNNKFEIEYVFKNETDVLPTFLAGDYDLLLEHLSVRGPEPFNLFTFFDPKSPHNITFFNDTKISDKLSHIESMIGGEKASGYSELSHYITQVKHYAIPLFTDIRYSVFNSKVKCEAAPSTILGNMPFNKVNL